MALSYRNLVNGNILSNAIGSGEFTNDTVQKTIKDNNKNTAKYIKGYAKDDAIEALANSLNINKGLFKQVFGLEDKKIDAYDPYHTTDAKIENFWDNDGKAVQKTNDEDTNTFKRSLYSNAELGGYRQNDFWYEDPFVPTFELFFDENSPLFNTDNNIKNSLVYFIKQYTSLDPLLYGDKLKILTEFKNVFFKIFEKNLNDNRNLKNKTYYIEKIEGLLNLNKKFIKYGEDKITITINEDVSMIAWYLAELYKNLIYSYKNQRYMFPENLIRFNMNIKINEMRSFQMPQSGNNSSENVPVDKNYKGKDIKYVMSPKSQIVYTLHDCNFNFDESGNYDNSIQIGGYNTGIDSSPRSLSFDIYFKSVTHYSNFPLITTTEPFAASITPWEDLTYSFSTDKGSQHNYYDNLDRIKTEAQPEKKGYLNNLLSKAAQTVTNQGLNYMDNLETKLRESRGSAVNGLLTQFRNFTNVNKIEPDNVYEPDFNNRASLANFGKQLSAGLLNDLETATRNAANF
jgi:hypothetical protein